MHLSAHQKANIAKIIFALPIPLYFWEILEKISSLARGKGWGMSTIEQQVKSCLSLLKYRPRIVLDIGANKGNYTDILIKSIPDAKYFLFEPSITNFTILCEKFNDFKDIQIFNIGLSDSSGFATLFSDSDGSAYASLTKRFCDHIDINFSYTEEIIKKRFDDFWNNQDQLVNNDIIDYVKIDVEGHELSILNGFGSLINQVRLVQFEFGACNIDTKTYFRDLYYFFNDLGFSIYRITPKKPELISSYSERDEVFLTTNFIAINRKLQ